MVARGIRRDEVMGRRGQPTIADEIEILAWRFRKTVEILKWFDWKIEEDLLQNAVEWHGYRAGEWIPNYRVDLLTADGELKFKKWCTSTAKRMEISNE